MEVKVLFFEEYNVKKNKKTSIYDEYKKRHISKIKRLYPHYKFKEIIQHVANDAKELGIIGSCMKKWFLVYSRLSIDRIFWVYPLVKIRYYGQIDLYSKNMKRKPDCYFFFK